MTSKTLSFIEILETFYGFKDDSDRYEYRKSKDGTLSRLVIVFSILIFLSLTYFYLFSK